VGHEQVLIATIAIGLSLAFACGLIARRLGVPVILGYLVAGVLVGPHTVGYVADAAIATELAEIGVILLMFGVGIHFSLGDLRAVAPVAVPGALVQIAFAVVLGTGMGLVLGWSMAGAVILGIAVAVASTVVLLRALIERGELDSLQGRIAVGWLVMQDLFAVAVLVLLPSLAPIITGHPNGSTLAPWPLGELGPLGELTWALLLAGIFALLMVVVGRRLVPWLLELVAREQSRELFTLSVLTIALGIAYAASAIFGVPLALGAFLAGALVSGSDTSHQAAADALPLRDAFVVLFFVSVGMLVDPAWLIANPGPVLAVSIVVIIGNALISWFAVALLGYSARVATTLAIGLAQMGEFSYIVVTLAITLGLVPEDELQLVVGASLVSITLNALLFRAVDPVSRWAAAQPTVRRLTERRAGELVRLDRIHDEDALRNHAVVVGHGRVGRLITAALGRRGFSYVVLSEDRHEIERLRRAGIPALFGDATNPDLLEHARLRAARVLVVAISDGHAAGLIVDRARDLAPRVAIVVRTHSEHERDVFQDMGSDIQAVLGEMEVAVQMARYALTRFGVSMREAEAVAQGLRGRGGRPLPRSTFTRGGGATR
jgi:CPA2 family monovalent cation:H+ antiporter-2